MTARQKGRLAFFAIEGTNSFASVLYFNYLYFYLSDRFGYDNRRNLAVAALLGLVYAVTAWQAGRFAQRRGYFTALKTGFIVMAVSLAGAWMSQSAPATILSAMAVIIGLCFTWPSLEALISESEPASRLPRAIGIYNVVWAVMYAFSLFIGGKLIEQFGFKVIFALPLALMLVMLALTFWQEQLAGKVKKQSAEAGTPPLEPHRPPAQKAKAFLPMAWLANPFAYIAINTLVAVIPGLAHKFQLSPTLAGVVCSLWGFARLAAFVTLWRWPGWHYRFHWLATAFIALILSFAAILMSPNLIVLVAAQLVFGAAIGLIYYSSLFYSMDAGDTKGEHGGIHEAVIGLGNCAGPAVGALSLYCVPQYANSGAVAVSVLLLGGLGGMWGIWRRAK